MSKCKNCAVKDKNKSWSDGGFSGLSFNKWAFAKTTAFSPNVSINIRNSILRKSILNCFI